MVWEGPGGSRVLPLGGLGVSWNSLKPLASRAGLAVAGPAMESRSGSYIKDQLRLSLVAQFKLVPHGLGLAEEL